jgi:hypothetical protein
LALGLEWIEVGQDCWRERTRRGCIGTVASLGVGEGKTEIEDEVEGHHSQDPEVDQIEPVFGGSAHHRFEFLSKITVIIKQIDLILV